jgi:hypothetical protein
VRGKQQGSPGPRAHQRARYVLRCARPLADDPSGDNDEVYKTVTCLACTRVHLINRSTGKVVGGDDE